MADREKRAQDMDSHINAPNLGTSHTRAPDRRRKEVLEMATGALGEGGRLPGMTKEYSAWDVYNNEARKMDTELVNDWRDSLNSLLLLCELFSPSTSTYSELHKGGYLRRRSYCLHHREQKGEGLLHFFLQILIKPLILIDARTGPYDRDNGCYDILYQ
jgi:Family of unknown function (DUF6535)